MGPPQVPAALAAALVEANARPVALLFTGDAIAGADGPDRADGVVQVPSSCWVSQPDSSPARARPT